MDLESAMRKLLCLGAFLILLIPHPAKCDETNDYLKHLNKIAPNLLAIDYQLLGGDKNDGTPFAGHCDTGCTRLIQAIESGRFSFIRPVIYTNSVAIFYKALISDTACKDLGVLSYVDSLDGPAGWSTDDSDLGFYRPTRGFAIYKLPFPYDDILILRGEDYVSSGVKAHDENSIDMNVKPRDIPTTQVGATLGRREGSFVEVTSKACTPLNNYFLLEKSIRYNQKTQKYFYDNNSWFANLILYEDKIYYLDAEIEYPIPTAGPKYIKFHIDMEDITRQDIPPTLLFFVPKEQ
jgi:hypothetical protein